MSTPSVKAGRPGHSYMSISPGSRKGREPSGGCQSGIAWTGGSQSGKSWGAGASQCRSCIPIADGTFDVYSAYADFGATPSTCQCQHHFPASSCKSRAAGTARSPRPAELATTSGSSKLAQSSSRMRWLRPLSGSNWPSRTNILTGGGSCIGPNIWSRVGKYAQNSSKAMICTLWWHCDN